MPEEVADRREERAEGPGTSVRDLRTRGRAALGRALPRLDPGMPGLRVLAAAGLLAAVVTGVLAWRSRPVAEPIAPPLPAAAVRDLSPAADPGAAAGATSRPAPARGIGAGAGPGATAYVAGAGGAVAATPGPSSRVVVYVTGKVRNPGVFVLVSGSRVADAVEAAGGLRKGANPGGINLARRLVDGEQIVAGSPATAGAGPASGPDLGVVGPSGAGVVNLNTATAEQLDALPGIGGVIAQRIVDYRDAHGGFQSVDQLKDVPGIGDRKFAEMRDKVSV
ncbi:ComEA family DNA-binding protein [Microbispora sp. NEAU-D428]|nr:ComEA family DNA-binding protein [Microbispora sitophila]